MLNSQQSANRRIVFSASQLYYISQKNETKEQHLKLENKDEREDSKVFVLGYN